MRWFGELLAIAESLYWLIGVFIVLGGFMIFLGEMVALLMKRRRAEKRLPVWVIFVTGRPASHPPMNRSGGSDSALDLPPRGRLALPAPKDDKHA